MGIEDAFGTVGNRYALRRPDVPRAVTVLIQLLNNLLYYQYTNKAVCLFQQSHFRLAPLLGFNKGC